jgi:hypothetical protein
VLALRLALPAAQNRSGAVDRVMSRPKRLRNVYIHIFRKDKGFVKVGM